ncbi:mucin-5B [Drosophila serrata]|uniref:mucin-5B n=1 Tax=Drosophila serrata TaxID=7274 RepID=UPI000A1D0608|nr:mucin-5B [Drosophila serrata]
MLHPRCLLSFLGLCLVISLALNCDARAVNVSNTWTMPQEGLNVFYRFFRDRISWFEADAVCQFHHANLVTVDNSFQFDATRDLLRELDVNDIVWIGLMRPQNSDRFMWSNSRPLVADTGYWAESLPLMDAPLCAVIDPIRDYRWHALRCGGPETASFLCEMPVPSWADACILKDMPNLTMQYMADTASIELIRNCQEEGLLRHTCKGKEDRERAIGQLICPKERLEAQRITDITNSHFKSLQIIKNIRTDNNENNDIDLLPNYGSRMAINIQVAPPVQRVSSVSGLGELMQSDAPGMVSMSGLYRIPDQVPKPVKKAAKKVIVPDFAKKLQSHQQHQQQQQQQQQQKSRKTVVKEHKEEMMMGDQPALSEEQLPPGMAFGMGLPLNEDEDSNSDASNEIFEHLPHKKKILPQDLRTMSPILEAKPTATAATTTTKVSTTEAPTTPNDTPVITTPKTVDTTSSQPAATRGVVTETVTTPTKEPITTTAKAAKRESQPEPEPSTTTTATTTSTEKPKQATAVATTTLKPQQSTSTEKPQQSTTTEKSKQSTTTVKSQPTTTTEKSEQSTTTEKSQQSTTTEKSQQSSTTEKSQPSTTTEKSQPSTTTEKFTKSPTTEAQPTTEKSQRTTTTEKSLPSTTTEKSQPSTTTEKSQPSTTTEQQHATHVNESADNTRFIPPMLLVKSHYVPPSKHASEHATITTTPAPATAAANEIKSNATPGVAAEAAAAAATVTSTTANPEKQAKKKEDEGDSKVETASEEGEPPEQEEAATTRHNFLEETEAPFKPNRRRSLTKPETVSYFKKILG